MNQGSYDSEALCTPLHTNDSEGWRGALSHNLLSGSFWNEKLLQEVTAGLAEELQLSPDAPGGMVDFRRTLTLSFFFKFYLTVLQKLGQQDSEDVSVGFWARPRLSAALLSGDVVWVRECCGARGKVASLLWASKNRGAWTRDTAQGATRRWEPAGGLRGRALGW